MSGLGDEPSVLEEGPLIWAIDDDPDVLLLLEQIMAEAGYRFEGFERPDAVFARASRGELPAVLILDWMLPGVSGHDVLRRIKRTAHMAPLAVIVLTALSSESVLINAFEVGADDIVRKPFAVAELLARIRWQLRHREDLSALRQRGDALLSLTLLAGALAGASELGELIERFCSRICEVLDATSCRVYIQDRERGELVSAGGRALTLSALEGLAEALAAREHIQLNDHQLGALGLERGGLRAQRRGTFVPLVADDRLVGAFLIVAPMESRLGTTQCARLLTHAAELMAVALERVTAEVEQRARGQRAEQREWELVRARDFLTSVIDASRDAIVAAQRDGTIVLFNRAAEEILSRPREDAIGASVRSLYPEGVAEDIMRRMRAVEHGGRGNLEPAREELLDHHGRRIPVQIAARIIYDGEEELGSVGVFTDLRQRLEIESMLQQATEDLERSRERAVMAELAGATAHELNQPLTSILNYAEFLSDCELEDERSRRAVEVITREVERVAEIVRRIGTITQYRTRDYVGGARIVDLGEESSAAGDEPPG